MKQLPLGVRLHDRALFQSFHVGANAEAFAALRTLATEEGDAAPARLIYLHGAEGSGKSHLLQALCAATPGAAYLPLGQLRRMGSEALDGMATAALLAVDDLAAVAGDAAWEEKLFTLYNAAVALRTPLAVGARVPATDLPLRLPDLRSRLAAMPHYALRPLDEAQQREALRARAAARGITLHEDALQYLQRRFARDMGSQYALLERLDAASLEAQRPLTVPFIRRVLGDQG